jgi:hypothetical protein
MATNKKGRRKIEPADLEFAARLSGVVPEWTITVDNSRLVPRSSAQTLIERDYHAATMSPGDSYPRDERERREVLLHECGHLLVADISGFIDRITALIPDPGARKLANQQADIFEEHICDRFAKAMIRALETHPPKSEQACECEGHS